MTEIRPEPPFIADERPMLAGWLDFHRATLQIKCAGFDAAQLATRAVPPSTMSLLGLVRHLADVERSWFDRVAGEQRSLCYSSQNDPDGDFDGAVPDQAVVDDAFTAWHAAIGEARDVAARTDLDATFEHPRHGRISLRWVLNHMIEEYARHNGHADLLREAIDGTTGE